MGRKKVLKEEGEHEVTISITIAKASETDFDSFNINPNKRRKTIEIPRAQSYFHCSYKLLPDDKESVKTDVVTFGVAAKLYTEHDSRVLRPWIDGNKTWVAWTSIHKVRITKDVLLKMFNHSLELKIWDAKERVSPRARFDRPKAFKLPPLRGYEESEIENMKKLIATQLKETRNPQRQMHNDDVKENKLQHVSSKLGKTEGNSRRLVSASKNQAASIRSPLKQHSMASPVKQETVKSRERPESKGLEDKMQPRSFTDEKDGNIAENQKMIESQPTPGDAGASVKVKVFLDENKQQQMGNLMKLAASGISDTKDDDNEENDLMLIKQTNVGSRRVSTGRSSKSKAFSAERRADALAAYIKIHGLASVQVKLSALFTGVKSIHTRIDGPVGTVEDLVISLTVDTPLLSELQRKALNPMIIRVSSACNMPSKPLLYRELKEKCIQPYISYKFHDESVHRACGSQHASKIFFNDTHVVLLGIKDKEKLVEYFRGPGLEIEVHDRDRNLSQKQNVPTIFGSLEDDHMINKANLVTSRRTEHNPFTKKEKPWDPYGVARLDMSDLILGERIIELSLPIRSCKIPDVIDGRGSGNHSDKIVGNPGSVDGPEYIPTAAANYVEFESELKAKIEVAYSIKTIEEIQLKATTESPKECPFARLVCMFDYQDKILLQKIQNDVMSVNAETLQLNEFPQHVIEAALSTYKLTESQRADKTLNIITGFQIIDGRYHVFVLEGLRDFGIKTLWDSLQTESQTTQNNLVTLYNTDITFQNRLYAALDVDLTRVRLHQPLDIIVKLPLLYVRDMVPRLCFQAVLKLHDLTNCKRLRDAIRNELFPTDEMIASLGREFGIPLTTEDLEDTADVTKSSGTDMNTIETLNMKPYKTTRPWTPLQLKNEEYEDVLKNRLGPTNQKNFLLENIGRVQQAGAVKREATITCDSSELMSNEVHNYSIQSLNTTEMAKKKLRDCLSEDPDSRFTYSQRFNSATVLPIDPATAEKEELVKSRKCWQTSQGFVFPGKKTSIESNKHSMEPDFARLDELKKPWRENILHSNKLKPTVKRVRFSWEDRLKDFDLLKKPKDYFGKPPPVTIQLAGDTLSNEQRFAAEKERSIWEKSLVVDNTLLRTYRCGTQTELLNKGFKSSSQVARLDDILRNEPRKHSLSAPGMRLEKIPAFSVVLNPTLDPFLSFYERLKIGSNLETDKDRGKSFNPGPLEGRSWLLDKNNVPTCDYNHEYFIERKGAEFSLCNTPKDLVYKRSIKPLLNEKKTTQSLHEKSTERV